MPVGPKDITQMKGKRAIAMLTCYDYSMAQAMDAAGIPVLLVGDSLGNVVLGFERTRNVTMQDMLRHTAAVECGAKKALVVADMPFASFGNPKMAIKNARLFLEAGAGAVKIEGKPEIAGALCNVGIPVMGHLGLLPQTAKKICVKGRGQGEARAIMKDAVALEKAGCFALVLECVPEKLGHEITASLAIPTIGIGAGRHCDGQVLVSYDMLGLFNGKRKRFVKQYCSLSREIAIASRRFKKDVEKGVFPAAKNCFW